jgi:hypothetical protein
MEYGAIDLHMRRSHVRIVRADGSVMLDRRIETTRRDLTDVLAAGAHCGF